MPKYLNSLLKSGAEFYESAKPFADLAFFVIEEESVFKEAAS